MSILKEAHRRNVFRVALAYVVTAWLLVQIADIVFEAIGSPPWFMQGLMTLIALGFLPALIFSWAFEVTPEGIKHESQVDRSQSITDGTGRKLDIAIILMILFMGGFLVWEQRNREVPVDTQITASVTLEISGTVTES